MWDETVNLKDSDNSEERYGEALTGANNRWAAEKLVQFQAWTNDAVNTSHQHHQAGFKVSMQCYLVHTV